MKLDIYDQDIYKEPDDSHRPLKKQKKQIKRMKKWDKPKKE